MNNAFLDQKRRNAVTSAPIQVISQREKNKDWFKDNIEFRISRTNFLGSSQPLGKDLRVLYDVYNNQFPMSWFQHITDPLGAKNPRHKKFPAKIRPTTILRTNLDLLLGEYPRRPFIYNVENLGEDGYIEYTEQLNAAIEKNLTQWFINATLTNLQESGQQLTPEQLQQLQENPPVPEKVKEEFMASYKDAIAIKGQKWLRRTIREKDVKKKLHKCFKDWLIAGQCYTYKGVENEQLIYERVSPLNLDFDKSPDDEYVEDGEWVTCRRMLTISSIVDRFYHELSEDDNKELESLSLFTSPASFAGGLNRLYGNSIESGWGKIPVYHVQWKGKRKVGWVTFLDPETFQLVEKEVDEDYMVDRSNGEVVTWKWVNVVYEGWRIADDIYLGMREVPVQRNEMNNASSCKLSYNGRKYSDLHSDNISVLEIGLPFQILYIITNYTLEKTIAKSKGKILLIDQNAIPNTGDWDDERVLYYAEALGYMLVDRSQPRVDRTWNQYQVVDMSLFEQIKQLIELQDYFKQQWDDIIGINRQRKGQTYASDGQGVNERAAFQSTVITDMIFIPFEEFQERELQGLLDYAKFLTAKGKKGRYNDDVYGTMLMDIEPEDFANAELGVYVDGSAEHIRKLQEMRNYAQAMIQNNAKPSTVMEVIEAVNSAELKTKLRQIEEIEQKIADANARSEQQSEQEHEQILEEIRERFMAYGKMLDREYMEAEYDRKEGLEHIKGTYSTFTYQDGDSNDNGQPDAMEAQKILMEREKRLQDLDQLNKDRQLKREEMKDKRRKMEHDMQQDRIKSKQVDKKLTIDAKKANKPTKQ